MDRRRALLGLALFLVPAAALAQSEATPEGVVRALYQVHLAAIEANRPGVINSPTLRQRFLTPALGAAIARELRRSQEGLGGDPITATNGDPDVRNLQIRQISADQERARVSAIWTRWQNERVELHYVLARINGSWLVYDILEPSRGNDVGASLRRDLRMRD